MKRSLQNAALTLYKKCRNQGWLERPAFYKLYQTAYFAYKRHLEDAFAPLVRRDPNLFRDGHILDVGANIGYTASVFSTALSPGFRVFAFEPEAKNNTDIARTVQRLHLENQMTVIRAAVGDHSGNVRLWLNRDHPADHRVLTDAFAAQSAVDLPTEEVALVSLDDFMASQQNPRVSFIKIDVQGYEGAVCKGMARVLEKNPQATIALEYYPKGLRILGFEPEPILQFFQTRGYLPHWLDRQGVRQTSYDTIAATLLGDAYADLLFRRT